MNKNEIGDGLSRDAVEALSLLFEASKVLERSKMPDDKTYSLGCAKINTREAITSILKFMLSLGAK